MEQWKKYQLKDVTTLLGDGLHGTPKYDKNGTVFFINGNNLVDGKIEIKDSTKRVSEDEANKYRKNLNHRTILVSINGTIGNVAKYQGEACILGKSACYFNVAEDFDLNFIYYVVASQQFKNSIMHLATGTTIKNVSLETMRNYSFVAPSINEQKRISSLLSSLDNKIDLNRRINDNLEKSMSTLFDFYFGLDNSESNKYKGAFLTDIATFINGLAMQKFRPKEDEKGIPVLKIKELGQKSCDSSSDICSPSIKSDYIVNDGDVIFSWSGTLLVDIWSGGKCGLNQHLFKVTSSNYPLWFAYLWTRMHLNNFIRISKDKAVTMGHIKRVDLERAEISIPTDDTMQKLDKIFTPIFDSCVTIRVENRKLSQIRDSLLPKLMSGELKTDDLHR